MKTRSIGNKANENPCLVDFLTSEGIVNLPQSMFPDRCYSEDGNNSRTRGACGEESRKFDSVSHGSSGDDRQQWRIICQNPEPTRPTRWQREVCRSIAEIGAASTGESFRACREPPAGRSNRVARDNPPVITEEILCRCNETDWNWLEVPNADHPLGSTQSVTKTDLR